MSIPVPEEQKVKSKGICPMPYMEQVARQDEIPCFISPKLESNPSNLLIYNHQGNTILYVCASFFHHFPPPVAVL